MAKPKLVAGCLIGEQVTIFRPALLIGIPHVHPHSDWNLVHGGGEILVRNLLERGARLDLARAATHGRNRGPFDPRDLNFHPPRNFVGEGPCFLQSLKRSLLFVWGRVLDGESDYG
jgi:hypothetical protein